MTMQRDVFLTDSISVFSSSGHVVRGSTTSALMPTSSSIFAAPSATCTMLLERDERDVAPFALHVGDAERNDVVLVRAPAP